MTLAKMSFAKRHCLVFFYDIWKKASSEKLRYNLIKIDKSMWTLEKLTLYKSKEFFQQIKQMDYLNWRNKPVNRKNEGGRINWYCLITDFWQSNLDNVYFSFVELALVCLAHVPTSICILANVCFSNIIRHIQCRLAVVFLAHVWIQQRALVYGCWVNSF